MNSFKKVAYVNTRLKEMLKNKEFVKARYFIQRFNNETSDSSVLKMILILTKYFSEENNIMGIRSQIKSLLEKRRGEKLI